jgi:hypothetical protein
MCEKYKIESLERKWGCVSKFNNICKLLVYEKKKQYVLSSLSVSKASPVVSPINN